jgi:hypothetical protein
MNLTSSHPFWSVKNGLGAVQCLIWDSGAPYLYLRTTHERRVIVGGEDEDFVNAKRRDALISQKT